MPILRQQEWHADRTHFDVGRERVAVPALLQNLDVTEGRPMGFDQLEVLTRIAELEAALCRIAYMHQGGET
jgi:hypothetical protein